MEKTLKAEILKKLINELVNDKNKSGYAIELWNEYCIDCSDVQEIYYNDNDGISDLCTYLEYIDIVDMASSGEYCKGDKFVSVIDNKFVSFNDLSEYFDTDKLVNDYLNKDKMIRIDFDEYIDFNKFIREYLNAIKNYDYYASTFAFEEYVTDNYNICELMEESFENIIKSASKDLTPPTSFYNKNDVWYAFEKLLKNDSLTPLDMWSYGIIHYFMMNYSIEKSLYWFDKVLEQGEMADAFAYWKTRIQKMKLLSQLGKDKENIIEQQKSRISCDFFLSNF
mgnify:CR=1 FL=1